MEKRNLNPTKLITSIDDATAYKLYIWIFFQALFKELSFFLALNESFL